MELGYACSLPVARFLGRGFNSPRLHQTISLIYNTLHPLERMGVSGVWFMLRFCCAYGLQTAYAEVPAFVPQGTKMQLSACD
jgi:hypothetical protein